MMTDRPPTNGKPDHKADIINFKIHKVTPAGAMSGKCDGRAQKRRQNLVQHWKFKPQNPAEIYIPFSPGFNKCRRNSEPTIQNFVSHFKVDPKVTTGENHRAAAMTLNSPSKQGFFSYKLPKEPASNPASPHAQPQPQPASPPTHAPLRGKSQLLALDCPRDLPAAAVMRRYSVPALFTSDEAEERTQLAPFSDHQQSKDSNVVSNNSLLRLPPLQDVLCSMNKTKDLTQQSVPSPPTNSTMTYEFPARKPTPASSIKDSSSPQITPPQTTAEATVPTTSAPATSTPTPTPMLTPPATADNEERMSIHAIIDTPKKARSMSVPNIIEPSFASPRMYYNAPTTAPSRVSVASLTWN